MNYVAFFRLIDRMPIHIEHGAFATADGFARPTGNWVFPWP